MRFQTLDEILRIHGAERRDKIAMRAGDRTWSYAQLHDESARVGQALLAAGIGPQDRVAFLARNVPEYFPFLFGAAMVDGVTLAVNWRLAPREMEYILNHSQARLLLIGAEFLDHLAKMDLETVETIVVLDGSEREGADGTTRVASIPYARWIASHVPEDPRIGCDPDGVCLQLYTSGTTGLPKGVELTHRNLLTALDVGGSDWSVDEESVVLVVMPLFHIAGCGWGIGAFYAGGEAVIQYEMNPAHVLRLIETHRVTNALFVPAVLQVLVATPGVEETDLSSLRAIVYGASPISEEVLVRSMEVFACDFIQVYGLTETSGAIVAMGAEDHDPGGPRAHLLRAAGKPWGDVRLRIVDEATGKDLREGEVGEIWCATVQNMRGYWRNDEATADAFPEGRDAGGIGWFRTGDAGYLKDGYLYIHDRVKDMIVSGGENIYPAEIENVLMGHSGVADVAVIGVPSEKWGETVKAIIVDAAGAPASDEELLAYCRERLAGYKCPTSIDRVEALPRNPSGKILKTELRDPYWEGRKRRVN